MNNETLRSDRTDDENGSAMATSLSPRRCRRFRLLAKCLTVGALVASVGGGLIGQPASAARLTSSGTIGYVGLPTGKCTHYPSWKRLDVTVSPPAIYAPDVRAGSGNDSAWVRYEVYAIDRNNNLVTWSNSSAWVTAYDNTPASFTGAPLTFTNIPDFTTVWMYVEWYGAGNAVYKLDSYQLYVKGLSLPYGPADSCWKYTPPGYVTW
jgi:hypothetical protein